ncbi:DUF4398 domain-containing protein [Aquitalea sp. ASV15]|uniref:DUF4398 domain-containing protein n=1 Tax=Aquitalea sp. ASV15 TaxID=2795104 RepID=UPI0018EB89E3|nr:DUF4398 domain-containing protein [Aquitalea sp. ASV15]
MMVKSFSLLPASLFVMLTVAACSSLEVPASNQVAVSGAAVDAATSAEGTQYAPVEMSQARDKLKRARLALHDHDYSLARDLAREAEADAKLAQAKANSAKSRQAVDALQDDVRVLNEELQRSAP